jgi:hypothetical protein
MLERSGKVQEDSFFFRERSERSTGILISSMYQVRGWEKGIYRCTLKSVNAADETATAVFMNGEERAVFFSDLKAPKTLQCS